VRYKFIRMNILYNPSGVVGIYFVVYTRTRVYNHGCEGVRILNNELLLRQLLHITLHAKTFRDTKKIVFTVENRIHDSIEITIKT